MNHFAKAAADGDDDDDDALLRAKPKTSCVTAIDAMSLELSHLFRRVCDSVEPWLHKPCPLDAACLSSETLHSLKSPNLTQRRPQAQNHIQQEHTKPTRGSPKLKTPQVLQAKPSTPKNHILIPSPVPPLLMSLLAPAGKT